MAVLKTKGLPKVNVQLFPQLNDVYHIETEVANAYVLPRIGSLLQHAREHLGSDAVHLCVPGDFLSPSCLSKTFKGAQMVAVLNALGTRYVCFGNHEFDEGINDQELLARLNESQFTWLNTNLQFADHRLMNHPRVKTSATVPLSPTLNLGLLGLIYEDDFGFAGSTNPISMVQFKLQLTDSLLPVRRPIAKERAYIALTHMTIEDDDRLAKEIGRLMLIMGGHDHEYLRRQDLQVTMIVKALSEARSIRLNWIMAVDRREVDKRPEKLNGVNSELYMQIVIPSVMRILCGAGAKTLSEDRRRAVLQYLGINAEEFLKSQNVQSVLRDAKTPLKGEGQDAGLIVDAARIPIHQWQIGDDYVFLYSVALRTDDPIFARLLDEDAEVRKVIESWLSRSPESTTTILKAPVKLDVADELVRRESTNFGNFAADVVSGRARLRHKDRAPASVGLLNGGSLRLHRNIPPGEALSERTVCDILFHQNKLLLYTLTKVELEEVLKASLMLRISSDASGHGDFLQVSGLNVEVDKGDLHFSLIPLPSGQSPPSDPILVATTEYVAQHCDAYRRFFDGKNATEIGEEIREAVVCELKAMATLSAPDLLDVFSQPPRWHFVGG